MRARKKKTERKSVKSMGGGRKRGGSMGGGGKRGGSMGGVKGGSKGKREGVHSTRAKPVVVRL